LWPGAAIGWAALVALALPGHHAATWPTHATASVAMVAVMAPLVDRNARYAAARSPAPSRTAVVLDVVAGWAAVWTCAMAVLGTVSLLLSRLAGEQPAIIVVTAAAAAWQYVPVKRRGRARCHRLLAPPLDRRRSRRVCLRYGARLGRDCVLSCGPLMALMAVSAHQPLVTAGCFAVVWYERRRRPHHDPATVETALVIAAIGATAFVTAVLS
jgi:predicted metal-binding membrane protein